MLANLLSGSPRAGQKYFTRLAGYDNARQQERGRPGAMSINLTHSAPKRGALIGNSLITEINLRWPIIGTKIAYDKSFTSWTFFYQSDAT